MRSFAASGLKPFCFLRLPTTVPHRGDAVLKGNEPDGVALEHAIAVGVETEGLGGDGERRQADQSNWEKPSHHDQYLMM
jgi:hypothetical protein